VFDPELGGVLERRRLGRPVVGIVVVGRDDLLAVRAGLVDPPLGVPDRRGHLTEGERLDLDPDRLDVRVVVHQVPAQILVPVAESTTAGG